MTPLFIRCLSISIILIYMLLSLAAVYGQVRVIESGTDVVFKMYKPNYFAFEIFDDSNGWYNNSGRKWHKPFVPNARFQISYAFGVPVPLGKHFFVTYTQKSFWSLSQDSAPFREHNFNPGVFIYSDKWISRVLPGNSHLDYAMETGYEHESNGVDGFDSRGWDRFYFKIDFIKKTTGGTELKFYAKGWLPVKKNTVNFLDTNGIVQTKPDLLAENIGYAELSLLIKSKSQGCELLLLARQKSIEVHFKPVKLTQFFIPSLICFVGKGESLLHATQNSIRYNIRLGLSLPYN